MRKKFSTFIFGQRSDIKIPERINKAIEAQQYDSEILIAWAQLAITILFAFLYILSPKGFRNAEFAPVPYALSAYSSFAVLRLVLTLRRMYPRTLPFIALFVDIFLLYALIWSFHIQYMQPAPFYLKVPTLIYVFIFITLRALRFDPVYVIVGGFLAASGWAAMVVYAVFSVPEGTGVITRNFVEYMTQNKVLIGAEVDKIIVILTVTSILALVLVRAKRVLQSAFTDQTTARDLSRFVTKEVVERVTHSETVIQPGSSELRYGTILFTDIEGFSTTAESHEPAILMLALNEYFSTVSAIIEANHGIIDQYQGDAMLVSFNTSNPDPDHAAHALNTALEIQKAVENRTFGEGLTFRTRCGINTGEVVIGVFGSHDRLLFTVHGDEVNVAARLETLNKEFGTYVLASESTVTEAGPAFETRKLGDVVMRGRTAPTRFYTISARSI